ncbi:MAG: ABC transporter substrate-binding protein [Candidatus Aminicenantes bacterium]|nr:ABC transporter substrate-binding protein [Candidatus Aminicenantes bacterium]
MSKKIVLIISVIILLSLLFSPSCKKDDQSVIKIGVVTAITGPVAPYGNNVRDGCLLATEEINTHEGINGHQIKLIIEDEESSPQKAVNAVRKLISVDKVQVIIGPIISSGFLAAAPIAEKDEVVLLSPTGMADNISDAGDYIFRNRTTASQEAGALANYIMDETKFRKFSVLRVDSDYSISFISVCKDIIEQRGGNILMEEYFKQGATDFRAQLTSIKDSNPDAIIIIGIPIELGKILKQIKELGLNIPLFSNSIDSPQIFELAEGAEDGLIFSSTFYEIESGSEKLKAFDKKFQDRFGRRSHFFAANAYDAIYILKEVLENNGYDGRKIKDGLYSLKKFKGVIGVVEFDNKGDLKYPNTVIKQIKNGEFRVIKIYNKI